MHLRGNLMLLLAAFIWGTTFVAFNLFTCIINSHFIWLDIVNL